MILLSLSDGDRMTQEQFTTSP